jgi:PPOX class probable FMN-dependent enzyme
MDGIDTTGLRALYGEPSDLVKRKALKRLDRHCRRFIELSPFYVIATGDPAAGLDVSPRGDPPGAVMIRSDTELLLPDRPGNRRLDTLTNLMASPAVALLFFIPGFDETLRVNGRARLTRDAALLARCAIAGKLPPSALLVTVEEAFLHCAKALIRSRLWDPAARVPRETMPSLGRIVAEQIGGIDADRADEAVAVSYRDRLY